MPWGAPRRVNHIPAPWAWGLGARLPQEPPPPGWVCHQQQKKVLGALSPTAGALLGLPVGWRQETGEGLQSCRDGPRAGEPPWGAAGLLGSACPFPVLTAPLCLPAVPR